MDVRRVVTGHTPQNRAIVVSDDDVSMMAVGGMGSGTALIWGRDDPGQFPDDGAPMPISGMLPPPGGSLCAVWELAPEDNEFDEMITSGLAPWSDASEPGMNRTPTLDYIIVLEGVIGLELD